MDLPFYQDHFGKNPIIKSRGVIGTGLVNVNALIQKINWAATFFMAFQLDITSSNIADTVGSTGARTLVLYGLDSDYNPLVEEINLAGQTKVTTVNSFRRLFAAYVTIAGTGEVNAGDIYIVKTGTGGTYTAGVPGTLTSGVIKILVGDSLGYSGVWTAPRGTQYRISSFVPAGNKAASIQIVKGFPSLNSMRGPYSIYKVDVGVGVGAQFIDPGITVEEKTDIYTQGIALAATTTVTSLITLEAV